MKECLKQNVELREVLDKLRIEQAGALSQVSSEVQANGSQGTEALSLKVLVSKYIIIELNFNLTVVCAIKIPLLFFQGELAKEQSRAESLSAQVLQLSAQLQQTTQAYNGLVRV